MGHTSFQLNRRAFLRAGMGSAAGALVLGPAFFERAFAAGPVTVGPGPYGPLQPFDGNGIALPAGFTSREIARGASLVPGSSVPYLWHNATDGQATFPTLGPGGGPDGGWILVANSEVPVPLAGGVSGVEFAPNGSVERAYRVLAGTTSNCAGGPTPWGTWLSCEEHNDGRVHECDPTNLNIGVARPALGVFAHEAVCVDPVNRRLYLTEDKPDGCLYRFTPAAYPSLFAGLLEVATGSAPGTVGWAPVPDTSGGGANPTRHQVPAAAHFDGGEGIWFDEGKAYFTTKGDGRVWTLDVASNAIEILYDPDAVGPDAPLSGVDNITVSPSGDVFVCEDGRDHDICMITPEFEVTRFLKLHPVTHSGPSVGPFAGNETVGVVFSPDGTRMYFGAQRSFGLAGVLPLGVVYEITGPFRQTAPRRKAPGLKVTAPRRRHIKKFLRSGLGIWIELDEPAGVKATLKARPVASRSAEAAKKKKKKKKKKKRRRATTLGRGASTVALNGLAALNLEPSKSARKALRNRKKVTATLEVVATDSDGSETTVTRKVILDRRKPRKKK